MPARKQSARTTGAGEMVLDKETVTKLVDLMDELAFRGPMQEALVMRIANLGGFDDVITRIKRRRLYTKKMAAGAAPGDDQEVTTPKKPRGKKKSNRRPRRTNHTAAGTQSEVGTAGD